jgi:hypothetical protein
MLLSMPCTARTRTRRSVGDSGAPVRELTAVAVAVR